MSYKIKVIWLDGIEEFLQEGPRPGKDATFTFRGDAQVNADFLLEGIGDEVQSVNVVQVAN